MKDHLGPYLLGPNDTPENGIYTGDARELAKAIPDGSVDLIFTDPVYDQMDDYRWLAEMGARTLTDNGSLLTFCGIGWLPETMTVMGTLHYRWTLGAFQPNGPSRRGPYHGFSKWYACLWYDKDGEARTPHHWPDMVVSCASRSWVGSHQWRKNPIVVEVWLRGFSDDGWIVFDPFTGGGTVPAVCKMLGRRYLAFEIDPDVAEMARERVRNTQPPLFVPQPEQATLNMVVG